MTNKFKNSIVQKKTIRLSLFLTLFDNQKNVQKGGGGGGGWLDPGPPKKKNNKSLTHSRGEVTAVE